MKSYWIIIVYLALAVSCNEDSDYVYENEIPDSMKTYFNSFALEASERGWSIDWDSEQISGSFDDIDTDAVGQCETYNNGRRVINIDKTYWEKSNDLQREFLIFHELGHCALKRSHLNEAGTAGKCISIMNSGENICSIKYNSATRSAYLDELFL